MAAPLPSLKDVLGGTSIHPGSASLPSLSDVLGGHTAAVAKPQTQSGGGSFLGNLASDVESTVANIPSGVVATVEHPVRVAQQIGHSYAQTYAPLVHGQFGKFFHGVEQHPLGPILDAVTLLTLGAGAAGKGASLLGKAGVLSEGSKLAELGSGARSLTVPDFAKAAGQEGSDIVVKRTATNPLIRARQTFFHNVLKAAPPKITSPLGLDNTSRALKAFDKTAARGGDSLRVQSTAQQQAFGSLNRTERRAFHFLAHAVSPSDYLTYLKGQPKASPAMLKILADPKLQALVDKPTVKLQKALDAGREMSNVQTDALVKAGRLDPVAAAEAPYRMLRFINGAEVVPESVAAPTKALVVARTRVDRLQKMYDRAAARVQQGHLSPQQKSLLKDSPTPDGVDPNSLFSLIGHHEATPFGSIVGQGRILKPAGAGVRERLGGALSVAKDELQGLEERHAAKQRPTGLVDKPGRDLTTLMKEVAAAGKQQPFYIKHTAETGGHGGKWFGKPTGFGQPDFGIKQSKGALVKGGRLNVDDNVQLNHFLAQANRTQADLFHEELLKHAARLPKGVDVPAGYEHLKINRGEASLPYTEKIGGEFEHGLTQQSLSDHLFARPEDAASHMLHPDGSGDKLIVPSEVRQILEGQQRVPHGILHTLLYNQPTSVWKHIILGLRPAFFGNITVGNSILGALQMAPGLHGVAGWLNHVTPGARFGSKVSAATMRDVFPEQALGSFGHSTGFTANKGLGLAQKAYQGVMPATIAYENVLRKAMVEGWAKATPEVRAAMKAHGGDVNAALHDVAKSHPQAITDISKRVDDALGNYRTYNTFEQKIKQLIPFYGWDRHIVRSSARIASERPGTANALSKVGQTGQQTNDKTLGNLPTFMQGAVKLNGLPGFMGPVNGRTPLLVDKALNPFSTDADLLRFAQALVAGKAGAHSEELASGLNPLVQSLIEQMTGRSLLTGGALPKNGPNAGVVGNVAVNTVSHLPQAAILAQLLGHGTPNKSSNLYQHDLPTLLSAFLGAPVKKTNLQSAHQLANLEGKPHR